MKKNRKSFAETMEPKGKRRICCCFRFRPGKSYFLPALKASLFQVRCVLFPISSLQPYDFLQCLLLGPLISFITVVTGATGTYCTKAPTDLRCANVYLAVVSGISTSIAISGLVRMRKEPNLAPSILIHTQPGDAFPTGLPRDERARGRWKVCNNQSAAPGCLITWDGRHILHVQSPKKLP